MFSITTIASSIRMPIESDSASIVMLLNVKPSHCMNANVATTLVGIATALISVARRSRRNSRMITTASTAPNIRSNCTSWIERSMYVALLVGIAERGAGLRHARAQLLERLLHRVRDRDGVRAGLLADHQRHRRAAVEVARRARALHAVDDLGDVAHAQTRRARRRAARCSRPRPRS